MSAGLYPMLRRWRRFCASDIPHSRLGPSRLRCSSTPSPGRAFSITSRPIATPSRCSVVSHRSRPDHSGRPSTRAMRRTLRLWSFSPIGLSRWIYEYAVDGLDGVRPQRPCLGPVAVVERLLGQPEARLGSSVHQVRTDARHEQRYTGDHEGCHVHTARVGRFNHSARRHPKRVVTRTTKEPQEWAVPAALVEQAAPPVRVAQAAQTGPASLVHPRRP